MKKTIRAEIRGVTLATSCSAYSTCISCPSLQACTGQSGNSYSVDRLGGLTAVSGYNGQTGSSWRETASTRGNTTTINGTDRRERTELKRNRPEFRKRKSIDIRCQFEREYIQPLLHDVRRSLILRIPRGKRCIGGALVMQCAQ